MIGTILPESDIQWLAYYKNYLVAFVIIGVEDELFDDVEAAKRYATSHNLYQHLGYAIIARLLIAPSSTDYTSDEVVQRGEVVEFEEYLRFDKQLNVWKK